MLACQPGTASSDADVLAREPSREEVNGFDLSSSNVSDISMIRNVGPVLP
jgi:hypothetical protein